MGPCAVLPRGLELSLPTEIEIEIGVGVGIGIGIEDKRWDLDKTVHEGQPQYTVGIDPDPDSDPDTDGNREQTDRWAGGTGNSLPVLRSNKRYLDIFTTQGKRAPIALETSRSQ
jgi:hypothetical protein